MKKETVNEIATEIMKLAHDGILVHMRFLDVALSKCNVSSKENMGANLFDGNGLIYDPAKIVVKYKEDQHYAARLYLHTMLHCIFLHAVNTEKLNKEYWNLATDIAVENTILELGLSFVGRETDDYLQQKMTILKKQAGGLTAEKIYRHFRIEELSERGRNEWVQLTHYDEHIYWNITEQLDLSAEEWTKLAERIKLDLKSFSKGKNNVQEMEENLKEVTREKHDYTSFLKRFMVMQEDIQINDDEFDYIYYTYGLSHYGNMPLVEPLEFKETNKIKDFVIAIDTSASCQGETVIRFLQKTYQIMTQEENFFTKINVHILQCDREIRQDIKITCREDFDEFINHGKLTGFGATDFRPVFDYVEELKKQGEFEQLKGLIYFTDGYGIYPQRMPDYETAFVFLKDMENAPKCPPWAIKVILEDEEMNP